MPPKHYEALKGLLYDAKNRYQQLEQAGYHPLIEEPQPVQQPIRSVPPNLPTRPTPSPHPGRPQPGPSGVENKKIGVVKSAGKQLKLVYE